MPIKLSIRIILVFVLSVVAFAESEEELNYKPGELLVRFKKDNGKSKSISEKQKIIKEKGCKKIKKSFKRYSDLHVVELSENVKVKDALKKFKESKDILYAEPNYKVYLSSTIPNDPDFSKLWGLHNTGQEHPLVGGGTIYGIEDADIDAPEAWDIYTGNQNIIVAVIDTGVNYTHPDLAANMWVNQAELIGDPNSDDDGNGYIDDIYGYDFADDDCDPNDYYLHGTHVAGTIGAVGSNGIGVTGVCWNVKMMSIKIFPNYGESTFISRAIEGIEYAVDNGATVLNNSWGGGNYSQSLKDAIIDANNDGVLFIAAAGNDGLNNEWVHHYPSDYDCENIISVLATNSTDEKAWFSNYGGASVDIGAPGEDIFSTFPTYRTDAFFGLESWYGRPFSTFYETIGGTSMAAPHVAGACALVWSMYPHLTASEVKQIVLDSADRLDSLDGLCVTGGRLNLYQALLHAHPLNLALLDDIADPDGCVVPNDEITFTITYGNPSVTNPADPNYIGPAYDTEIHFPLPEGLDYFNLNDPNYSIIDRTYVWQIGTLAPQESGEKTLTLTVNANAEPLGEIKSKVKMYSSIGYGEGREQTRVCCWGGDRIYVSAKANGYKTGVTWDDSYTSLQDALQRVEKDCGNEIWVAGGIYTPTKTRNQHASFGLIDGVKLYGGFGGYETSLSERNVVVNRTYLSGNIDVGGDLDSFIVVNTQPDSAISSDTILDGFLITHSTVAGISCNQADPVIRNCVIADNDANGINIYQSAPYLYDSVITGNGAAGVFDCNESYATIDGCIISKNGGNGISCRENAAFTLTNSWVHNNGRNGIGLSDAASGSLIRNNTIVYNSGQGILAASGYAPTVKNCIVWGNQDGDIDGCSPTYSCFDGGDQGTGNIDEAPFFVCDGSDMPNYHLRFGSPCRDAGDGSYPGEYDIDREPREYGSKIDMGADEIYCIDGDLSDDDVYHAFDWNSDGLLNLREFNYFSRAWLSHDPNDPAFNPNDASYNPYLTDPNSPEYIDPNRLTGWYEWKHICNLEEEGGSAYQIDLADLEVFWNNWCWKACYVNFDTWMHTFGVVVSDTDEMYESQTSTAMALNTQKKPAPIVEEKTIVEQLTDIQEIAGWLKNLWNEDPSVRDEIDEQQWNEFMHHIYDWRDDLIFQLSLETN